MLPHILRGARKTGVLAASTLNPGEVAAATAESVPCYVESFVYALKGVEHGAYG
jgi:hypothetical protein